VDAGTTSGMAVRAMALDGEDAPAVVK